ncbi:MULTISPECIES: helix-turn-helix domain-containing protein [Bacteroides]|jgi:transcriptional regulator with XRE-family HTH domain|uniref:helix-turn-helix domain-containing protein n=1 Tax=Bacteroides TaxID=816 RepID=UPI00164CCB9A|nr:helix-turn-helix transcriptional regulator [Bacteroides sp. NSJ-48]MBC5610153.1 helix-turn-helix transcriptional regulator [Bacteroides sp. NSJ-48]
MESRIKELLKEKGITISNLAEQIGTTQTSLSRALGDNGNPTYETLNKIANVLNVEMSELFKSNGLSITCPHCGKNINIKVE